MPQKRNQPAQKGAESFASSPLLSLSLIFSPLPRERRSRPRRGEAAARHLTNGFLVPSPRRASRMRALPVTSLRARSEMEGYSRDLLGGINRGDAPPQEQEQRPGPAQVEMEEVELSLGLSLGGRFGVDRKGEKLARSSSVAAVLTAPVEVAATQALVRTSSLPVEAEASEAGRKQGLDDWGSGRETGGLAVEPAARLQASGSPSSGSSDGEGLRLQDTLVRSTSLPAGIEAAGTEEWRKRKAAQSQKRLELKKRRVERRNSLTCSSSKEVAGQILEEVKKYTDNTGSCDDKYLMKGLPPKHQATSTSQDRLSAVRRKQNSAFKGTATAEEHSPSSTVTPPGEAASSATVASPPLSSSSSSLAGRGDQQSTSGTAAARARSMGDVERAMMKDMPSVFTNDLPNGNRVEGFLYKYRRGEEVRIVCICHGSFHTPAEFVEHAGGGNVANPLRHIVVTRLDS